MKMNAKQRRYYEGLKKYLVGKKFTEEDAEEAAMRTVKTLKKTGNDRMFSAPSMMGRMIVREMKRVERGDVVKQDDGSLLDTKTGRVYKK